MIVAVAGPVDVRVLRDRLDRSPGQPLPAPDGGTAAALVVRGLLDVGQQVVAVGLDPTVDGELVLRGPSLTVHVGHERRGRRARDAFALERGLVRRALASYRPDVVHAHWTYEYALGALATGIPTVVTVHDWAPTILRLTPDLHRAVRLGMGAAVLARARHLTAPSPYLARRVRRWTRRPVPVVPNGLPDESFAASPPPVRDRPRVLLSVNNGFGAIKNTTTLLAAHAIVRRHHPDLELWLVGRGYEPDGPAARWARARGLDAGVVLLGRLDPDAVRDRMAASDLLVHPSVEESFGLVIVEAMAQGLPVIAGAASGAVPWVLDGGRAGRLTDVRDPQRLADATLALMSSPGQRAALAAAGHARARSVFHLEPVARRYIDLYAETCSTVARGAPRPS